MKIKSILKISCLWLLLTVVGVVSGNSKAIAADPGVCADRDTGGIFLYALGPYTWTFSIINMTPNNLVVGAIPDPALFSVGTVVDAYRSRKFQHHVAGGTQRWEGNLTIRTSVSGSLYNFDVKFAHSNGLNGIYPSTWIYLPVPSSSPYSPATGWAYGRWSTGMPVGGDHKMHNIMTIVSDKIVASLYSVDNKHVTLVVSDAPTDYAGTQLDWVWNDGRSVPSACGLCSQSYPNSVDCN